MYENLKKALSEQGISVYRLAKLSDIAQSDLYMALKNKKPMFPKWKERIAEALNADVKDLFNEEAEGGSDGTI